MTPGPLERFAAPTRAWFEATFAEATPVQLGAWEQIRQGTNTLVISPTGSGKTLAAFLHAIDRLITEPEVSPGVKVLYISPLKALGVDVEKNLQRPLQGITLAALEQGISCPTIRVGVRSGDTTPAERRQLITNPPPILITTPESLFLMLSSAAASILATVETIIVDEIHYLAGNKRGAHLAVSLERVEALQPPGRVQRIGLSATVRPPDRVAAFLSGRDRPTAIVAPRVEKNWDLQVAGATEDMSSVNGSIWPDVEQMIYNAITTHRSTICFSNSRAQAERLTNHLNTLHREANPHLAELVLARTHHGSIAKGLRIEIENELKAGVLPCVVATSSLELGIDMGAVDLVIQVGAPPSVASGLQRIGRGGHQVSAISKGLLIPLARSDLLATAVVTKRMAAGEIEAVHRISNPLDVLAQQIVSMCLDTPQTPEQIFAVITQADCFCDLPQPAFSETIDMLTGKYPSEDFTELRPRLIWDRAAGVLTARPGARRLVTTSGGTIPDRGLYPVFMVGDQAGGTFGKHAVSRRVGELDEEMVFESRVGEVFTLGTSSWRIEEINPNQVLVSPAFGQPGKLPFWLSDAPVSRSAAVGRDIGQFVAQGGTEQLSELDEWSKGNLQAYLTAQRDATGVLPDERTILVERHRDEMGAWRVCIHCQLGRAVLQPWAMAIMAEIRRANSHLRAPDLQAYVTDDGITIRLGEVEDPNLLAQLVFDADEIERIVARETESSALFAAHFRQCAARALLLPRRDPGKRSPLWLQRLRSAQLLGVAASYPNFPIIAEALRECLDDVFDLANLKQLMRDIAARTIRIVEVETARPSPFAAALLFGYTGAFLYDADQPLAERANVASLVDADYLAALLGSGASQLLDETACAEVEARLQRLAPGRGAQTKEAFWDLLRQIGPLTEAECQARSNVDPTDWLADLRQAGRIIDLTIGSTTMVALSDDAAIFGSIGEADSLRRLVLRWVRHHGITTPEMIAARYALDPAIVRTCLESLRGEGLVERGIYSSLITGEQYLAVEVLARIRRRIITRLRAEVKPVAQARFASLVTRWQELDRPGEGREGLSAAVEQLAGYPIPYSMLESVVLPSRVKGYTPALLDQAMLDGEVYWSGQGSIGSGDGWICLWPADLAPLTLPRPLDDLAEPSRQLWERFALGGAWTIDDLTSEGGLASAVETAIWELVWAGWLSSDTLAPVRLLGSGKGALKRPPTPRARRVMRPVVPSRRSATGRWFALPERPAATDRLVEAVGLELARYGILTRGSVLTEPMTPSFFDAYRVCAAMEEQGTARRGYFVDNLGAAQFALPGSVDRLREDQSSGLLLVAACDPANPWGAGLPWPESQGHRPTRKAGALVVLDDGWPIIYLERGAHTLITFTPSLEPVITALKLVGDWIDHRHLDTITITRINSDPALSARDWQPALEQAGFTMTPQGFRRRPV